MKKGTGKRKRLLALLAAVIAAAGCLGMASVANASTPQRALSSSSQARKEDRASSKGEGLEAEVKILQKERQLEAKKLLTQRKKAEEGQLQKENKEEVRKLLSKERKDPNLLEASGETTEYASVIGGGQWTGGVVNHDTAAFSTSSAHSPSISSSNSVTLSVSSPLYWIPFYFEGGSMPITSSGTLDVKQVKSWVLSGNFASGAYIGLADLAEDYPRPPTFSMNLIEGPGQNYTSEGNLFYTAQSPLFGGVDPKTGDLLSGGITATNSSYFSNTSVGAQTFEAFTLSQCESNSSLSGGVKTDTLLGALSTSPSSCLEAFQKNAEAVVKINGTSYDLLSYSGIQSLLSVLAYSIPSNSATGYQGPGYLGPVTVTVGLSPALMYLFANYPDSFFGQSLVAGSSLENESFSYQVDVYKPDSSQTGYVKGNGLEWIFNPSLYQANFKAVTEDGEPLKEVYITVTANNEYGAYIAPGYWDSEDLSNSALSNYYNNLEPLANPSSYKYFGWVNSSKFLIPLSSNGFVLDSISGEPGEFSLPKLPSGTYSISASWFNNGTIGIGTTIEGSSYKDPTFNITLGSNGETISPQGDSDGFIDPSTRTVVMEAHNPFAEVLNSEGEAEESPDISRQYGKEHTFTYQLQAYLPYSAPFSLSFDPGASYNIELADAKVAGIAISTLKSHGLVLSGDKVTLNASAISYVEQNGYMPASYSSPGGATKLSSQGKDARIFSITLPTYLSPSFKAGNAVSYTFSYSNSVSGQSGQTITGNLDDEDSNNGWFRAVNENGKPLSNLTIQYREQSPSGTYEGIKSVVLSSSPTDPGLFVFPPELLPCLYQVDVGIPEGNHFNFDSPSAAQPGESYVSLFSLLVTGGGDGISFSNSDGLAENVSDPSLVDSATQTVIADLPNPSSQILTPQGTVDTSPYPTETVGKDFASTYQIQFFFSTFPAASGYFGGSPSVPYTQKILISAPPWYGISQDLSDVTVAGLSLSELKVRGASVTSNGWEISISLPPSALLFIASQGYNPATASEPVGKVPFSGICGWLPVTFKAYLTSVQSDQPGTPSIGITYQWQGQDDTAPNTYGPFLYTNGSTNNSAPSSLSMSSPSSDTGLWWESLWWGKNTPAEGAKFMVQNQTENNGVKSPYYGNYLAPVEDGGTFEGWEWQSSPYDFENNPSSAYFSMGGLANGTYKVQEVSPATSPYKASLPSPAPAFTATLTYSPSPSSNEVLFPLSNPKGLLSSLKGEGIVYSALPVVSATSLPLTGGRDRTLPIFISSVILSLLGAGSLLAFKKKRGGR